LRATRRRVSPIAQAPPPRLAAGELPDVEMLGLEILWGLATSLFDLAFRPGVAPWRRQRVGSSAAPRARTRGGDASAPPVPLPGRARSTRTSGDMLSESMLFSFYCHEEKRKTSLTQNFFPTRFGKRMKA